MVEKLYSEFDANLTISSAHGKTFDEKTLNLDPIRKLDRVAQVSKGVEEIVIIQHEKKWANATLFGVEDSFLELTSMEKNMINGKAKLRDQDALFGIIGAGLLNKVQGAIPEHEEFESVQVYFPKREAKMSIASNPFRSDVLKLSGDVFYNKMVSDEALIVPLEYAQEMLNYESDISAVYIDCKNKEDLFEVQEEVQQLVGSEFVVKTHYEKNALIYQTSKTEKIIVICILVFIFILAIFNLVASLTMLYIEKKDNLFTMQSYGADRKFIFNIFFYEGILISFKGIFFGLILGLAVAGSQIYFNLVELPNSDGQPFPMFLTFYDILMVVGIVTFISIFASYLSIFFLLRNQQAAYEK